MPKHVLRKSPYRGIVAEVAREQGVSHQAIWAAINVYKNPRIMEIVAQKMRTRKRIVQRINKEFANACA